MSRRIARGVIPLVFASVLALPGIVQALDSKSDLLVWWPLNEGKGTVAVDHSGNGYNGTFAGAPQWVPGHTGSALHFDGVDDYAAYNFPAETMNACTVGLWVKSDRLGQVNYAGIFASYNPNTAGFQLDVNGGNPGQYRINPSGLLFGPASTDWVYLSLVANGTSATLYYNGVQAARGTLTDARWDEFSLGVNRNRATFWAGIVDDLRVYNRTLTDVEIQEAMTAKGGSIELASDPRPADQATDMVRDVVLGWTAGGHAASHDVYLGTLFADVNTASRTDAKGVLAHQGQAETTFDPAGLLLYGQTYYWRIDEVNKAPDNTIFKGDVWSFRVEPYAYPIKPLSATASSAQAGMGPEKTIDGSGLTGDQHGTEPATMWLSAGVPPNWIQYQFDKIYKLYDLKVWNSNQMVEGFVGFGAKKVTVEASTDGTTWAPVPGVPEFARASGTAGYAANTTVSLGGIEAKYVKLTIHSAWGGQAVAGLSEVQFSYVPVQARAPQPAPTATGVSVETSLNWRPGREAASHKVYFGADQAAVTGGNATAKTVTDHSFSPGILNLATTYYWRVDEANAVTYPGDVWSFTTEDFKVVDDFESYTDQTGNEIFSIWVDGFADKSSGSTVGLQTAVNGTFGETTIRHGGRQAMPLAYDNTKAPSYSEAVRTFDGPQDWTASGIKSLSLWFQGVVGNGGQLYVKINGNKVLYDGDAADLARSAWQVWNIDLSKAGNVSSVRSLTIGIEGAGTKGMLYLDDIRLYGKTPEYITPVQPAATGLVAYYTFDDGSGTTVKDSSGKGNHGTFGPEGTPKWVTGKFGGGLQLDGNDDYVNIDGVAKSMPADNNFTVSAWIKTTTADVTRLVVASNDSASGHDFELGLAANGNLLVEANTAHNYPPKITDGQWHMIAYVRDGTTAYLYTDGILVGTETPSGNPAGQVRWSIGQEWDPPSPSDEYLGDLDDVRIYTRPLSAGEVAGLAGLTKSLAKPF